MQIPAWLGSKRLRMAGCALSLLAEDLFTAFGRFLIEAPLWRQGGGKRELILVQCRKLCGNQIRLVSDMSEPVLRGNRKLLCVVQSRIEERAFAVHFQVGNKGVPVGNGSPSRPGMQVHSR